MSEIDWSKAPEGATHYHKPNGFFYCRISDVLMVFRQGEWHESHLLTLSQQALIPRPSSAGSGEGLPPVGSVLEYMWNYKPEGSEYVQVEILVHDKGSAVMRTLDGPDPGVLRESRGGNCGPGRGQPIFRLIRTPEQIAADEREASVAEMLGLFGGTDSRDTYLMQRLYDAGYRKMEQPQ